MADAHVDLELVADLALDYVEGAEAGLDAELKDAWDAFVAAFGGLTLSPLFASMDVDALADMVDGARIGGEDPPDPFTSFSVACDESIAAGVHAAAAALPFVESAHIRPKSFNAGIVSWGTNPHTGEAFQLMRAPAGVDAVHAWQIEGGTGRNVRVADIENGWDLGHEDLLTASVERASTFGNVEAEHGNGTLGVILASDNGVGIVGIALDAQGFLVTAMREGNVQNPVAAIAAAAAAAKPGGVVLIEQAAPFFAIDPGPDIPWEFHPPTQKAIRIATFFGITVVEAAGNGKVNLDAFPFLEHLQPDKPRFVDSRAIVVGAGSPTVSAEEPIWQRSSFSTFGRRVDCFAPGAGVRAPSLAPSSYQFFRGTSAASAIVAGAVCAIQGMAQANRSDNQPLFPTDIRRLLRDPALGTPTGTALPGSIGVMPDLRKIARHLGFARILPAAVVAPASNTMMLVHLDDDDTLVRREWTPATLWGDRVALHPLDAGLFLSPQHPAVITTVEPEVPRVVTDVVAVGVRGEIHHVWWDTLGQTGRLAPVRALASTIALGRDVAAVRPLVDSLVVVGIDRSAHLIALNGDARLHLLTGLGSPVTIDALGSYRRCAGPALATRGTGQMDVIAIEDGGTLRWAVGTVLATVGTGWAPMVSLPSAMTLDPGARSGLVVTPNALVYLVVGTDGLLRSGSIGIVAPFFVPPDPVDANVTVTARGPVALVSTGTRLVAVAVGTDRRLRAAFRDIVPASSWTPLAPVDPDVAVSPLGGASAVVVGNTVSVLAMLPDGRPCWSQFVTGLGWLPLLAG